MVQNKQNQTDPSWIGSPFISGLGTGLFLIPDVERAQSRAIKKVFVPNLTYEGCVERGSLALVFKWIPNSVQSYNDLTSQACSAPCVDTCVEPGCACYDSKCQ